MHAGDPTGGVPGEGEGEQGQETYQAELFPWLQKILKMAAMNSHLFGYVVFYFLLKLHLVDTTFIAQRSAHIT